MRLSMLPILGLLLAAPAVAQNFDEGDSEIQVLRNGSQASVSGPVANFTGSVRVDSRFNAPPPARIGGGTVTFEPGARTAWHTHPLGQTLIITSGIGWVQSRGGPVEEVHPGDIVWIPPNAEHWHGATAENAMSHIAISEKLDGIAVNWLEKVTDAEYRAGLQ